MLYMGAQNEKVLSGCQVVDCASFKPISYICRCYNNNIKWPSLKQRVPLNGF